MLSSSIDRAIFMTREERERAAACFNGDHTAYRQAMQNDRTRYILECPNFGKFLDGVCKAIDLPCRETIWMNIWAVIRLEAMEGNSYMVEKIMEMGVCDDSLLTILTSDSDKPLTECLKYLARLFGEDVEEKH